MSVWRKFLKFIFLISLVVCTIGVLVSSIILMVKTGIIGFVVMVFGLFGVMLLHAFIGVFLELCENIAAIRMGGNFSVKNCVPVIVSPDDWTCPNCGGLNAAARTFCGGCGRTHD